MKLFEGFAPLVAAVCAAAAGDADARRAVEQVLPQLEANGWRLTAPIRLIWDGQRAPQSLTAGLDKSDALIVRAILEKLA